MKLVQLEVNEWAVSLVRFVLKYHYGFIIKRPPKNSGYDLVIEEGYEGTPFKNKTILLVRARGRWSDLVPLPQGKSYRKIEEMKLKGYDFWICFVKYVYEKSKIGFNIYLIPEEKINKEKDCRVVKKRSRSELQIISKNLIKKAALKIMSISIRDWEYDFIGFWRYASNFYCAARNIYEDDEINIVAYYLYGHAIELVLKAVLVFKEFQEEELKRRIGHNLIKAWEEAIRIEPSLADKIKDRKKLENVLKLLNPYYQDKEFEYIKVGFKSFPLLRDVQEVVEDLLFVVGEIISIPLPQLNKKV